MEPNLVSVIIPCYNHERFVDLAIESILNQTYRNLEIIIVDDCSTDESLKKIEAFANRDPRIKVIRHVVNKGLSRSRNDALKITSGEFIAFCASDDIWEDNKL